MNLDATCEAPVLDSIEDPILRQIKEFDYRAMCNPTSFTSLVLPYLEELARDEVGCPHAKKLLDRFVYWREYWKHILEEHPEKYKELDRIVRFEFLHELRLIPFMEYRQEWIKWWGYDE